MGPIAFFVDDQLFANRTVVVTRPRKLYLDRDPFLSQDEVDARAPAGIGRCNLLRDDVVEVRGKGLMIGVELVADATSRQPAKALADRLLHRAFERGLLLLTCGQSTVRFMPPLMISTAHVDEAVGILEESLKEAQVAVKRAS